MIAFYVHNVTSYSGAALQALNLARAIDKKVTIFNHSNDKFQKWQINSKITVINVTSNPIKQLVYIFFYTLKRRIKIHHFHGIFNVGMAIALILRGKSILKTTLVGDDDFQTLSNLMTWKIRKIFMGHLHKNIVQTKQVLNINSKFIDSKKLELIPNAVQLNKTIYLEDKENLFCIIGAICERKSTYESILYFIENYSNYKNYKLKIIGPLRPISEKSEIDITYIERCIDLVTKHNLNSQISFTGLLGQEETLSLMIRAKAMIFFSKKEGMPNVILEALASNCVPITHSIDGLMEEIFVNKRHGFILDGKEKIPIYEIESIIKSGECQALTKTKYAFDRISDKVLSTYD